MWKPVRRGRFQRLRIITLALFALFMALGAFTLQANEKTDGPYFISGASVTTIEQHRHLLAALSEGELTRVPNSDTTPRFPRGSEMKDIAEGYDTVFVVNGSSSIKGATDSATVRSLRLFLPGETYPDRMNLEFRDGQTTDGALLFITNTSFAWNWSIIGYPATGTVRLTRTGQSNIDAEFDVEYRCIRYVHRRGEDGEIHGGWEAEPAKQCPQKLFPQKISFKPVAISAMSLPPRELYETGGAS